MTNSLRVRLTDSQRKKLRDLLVGRYENYERISAALPESLFLDGVLLGSRAFGVQPDSRALDG
jgi:hypothetical protein